MNQAPFIIILLLLLPLLLLLLLLLLCDLLVTSCFNLFTCQHSHCASLPTSTALLLLNFATSTEEQALSLRPHVYLPLLPTMLCTASILTIYLHVTNLLFLPSLSTLYFSDIIFSQVFVEI